MPDDPLQLGKLFQPGLTSQGVSVGVGERIQSTRLKVSRATRLVDLIDEYHFYTPALMYLKVPLRADPYADYLREQGHNLVPLHLKFQQPVFAGLGHPHGDQAWNYGLMGLPRESWQKFHDWMLSLQFMDEQHVCLYLMRSTPLEILDPLAIQRAGMVTDKTPRIQVTGFCIETTQGCHFFRKAAKLGDLPTAIFGNIRFADTQQALVDLLG